MSQTFTLKGRSHILEAYFSPPLELDPKNDYSLALVALDTWNSIPNIEPGKNKFYYTEGKKEKVLTIPTGSYELEDFETYIRKHILNPKATPEELESKFSLKSNNNTLKCELKSVFDINFKPDDSIGSLLGFSKRVLKAGLSHESDLPVDIIQVTTIRVECNIISGTYYVNNPSHTLYEFSPAVDPGYSINIEPRNLIYLPVNRNSIDNITLTLLDQDSKPLNFRGEEVVIRLELKRHGLGI